MMHAIYRRSSHISLTCAGIVINFNVTAMSKTPGNTKNVAQSTLSNDSCLRSRPSRISTHFVRRASVKCHYQYSTGPTGLWPCTGERVTAADTSSTKHQEDARRLADQMCGHFFSINSEQLSATRAEIGIAPVNFLIEV